VVWVGVDIVIDLDDSAGAAGEGISDRHGDGGILVVVLKKQFEVQAMR
jgi:hypothetical protein